MFETAIIDQLSAPRAVACSPAAFPWLSWPARRRFMVSTPVAGPTDPTATGLFHALAAVWRRCPVPSPIPALLLRQSAIHAALLSGGTRRDTQRPIALRASDAGAVSRSTVPLATFTPNASTGRPSGGAFRFRPASRSGHLGWSGVADKQAAINSKIAVARFGRPGWSIRQFSIAAWKGDGGPGTICPWTAALRRAGTWVRISWQMVSASAKVCWLACA